MGTLVKKLVSEKLQITPDKVFHVTIMPCYDKKLEGARNDFYDETFKSRDVDCVLTSGEIQQIIEERNIAFGALNADLAPS